ncbi:MAG: sugar phosphate isomerase/epimerase [Acidobacteriaceae bacterium]|nr:sugar phosphate isomerase/epimerase [Acidobacteriaceae bacterium]
MVSKFLSRRQAVRLLVTALLPPAGNRMFLSLNSVLVSGRVGWPEFARLAAKVGFPGTDVMLQPAMKAGAEAISALLSELKLRPAVLDFPVEFRKDDVAFRASLPELEQAAPFAAAIGCPRMITWILPSSDTPKDELRRTYKQRFTESARILARSGVRLGLEFLGPLHLRKQFRYEFIWRMNDMLEFAKECGPNVGLLLDTWHWHHAGATTEDIIRAGRERIVHVHFNDSPDLLPEQIRDDQRLLPGEGVINLAGFLHALEKIGYTDALSVEVFGRGLSKMTPEAAARLGLETSLAVFRKAGVPQPRP